MKEILNMHQWHTCFYLESLPLQKVKTPWRFTKSARGLLLQIPLNVLEEQVLGLHIDLLK